MKHLLPVLAGSSIIGAAIVLAGPLTPPAGPVASTYKSLAEIEPRIALNAGNTPGDAASVYKITQPGSYYLTGNITGQAGKTAVLIAASRVNLDLNGFTISGGQIAIGTSGPGANVTVRNGEVAGCDGVGVYLSDIAGATVADVRVAGSNTPGILVGKDGTVLRCRVTACGLGFGFGSGTRLEDCTASDMMGDGFYSSASAMMLVRCAASDCADDGFDLQWADDAVLESCVSRGNTHTGILAGEGSRVLACVATGNDEGIRLFTAALAERCIADHNGGIGIVAWDHAAVRACHASLNTAQGIRAGGDGVTIAQCQASNNGPGLANIWVSGNGCRVEDNRAWGAGFGLYVEGLDNIVVKNCCRGSTNMNYSVVPGNEMAPVVVNPGSNNFGTATAWSNFSY